MRRSDREVKEFEDIVAIMKKCDLCRIALNNDGYPYILPLNFELHIEENKIECTMEYESVIGQDHIEILSDDEKYDALCILMEHNHQEAFLFTTNIFAVIINMTYCCRVGLGMIQMEREKNEDRQADRDIVRVAAGRKNYGA